MTDSNTNISNAENSQIIVGSTISGDVSNRITMQGLKGKEEDKLDILDLINKLEELAKQLPPENTEESKKISKRLKGIVEEIQKDSPDREDIEFNLESLQKAATNVAMIMPSVLSIATDIAARIRSMIP